MRNSILLLILLFGLFANFASAQPGKPRPPGGGGGSMPKRPQTQRSAAQEEETPKPATRPSARFTDDQSSEAPSGESSESSEEAPAATRGGSSRFGGRAASAEPPAEESSTLEDSEPAPREDFRSAGLDHKSPNRSSAQTRRQLQQHQEETAPAEESTEPAPLSGRGAAQSLEGDSINVKLNKTAAGVVLEAALNLEHTAAIKGYPLRMEQVLAATPDNAARRAAVKAYWNMVVSIADHHHALDELDRIAQMAASSNDKLLEAAAAAAEARVAETKLIAAAAQYDLASFTPSPALLPIPADAPLIGEYRTEFSALFGRGAAPIGIKRLATMLPLYYEQATARGRAVYAASEAQATASDLETFKELAAHRRAFLAAIRDYNDAIADYALQLATPGMTVDAVTSMLIVRRQPEADAAPALSSSASRDHSRVVQANAAEQIEMTPENEPLQEKTVAKPIDKPGNFRRAAGFRDSTAEKELLGPDEELEQGGPSAAIGSEADEEQAEEPSGEVDRSETPARSRRWNN